MNISRREFYLDMKYEELDEFFHKVRSSIAVEKVPENYTINVLKDQVVCCGIYPIGVSIEIEGPNEQQIRELDQMTYSKIIEICEREGIEYHESRPLEVL